MKRMILIITLTAVIISATACDALLSSRLYDDFSQQAQAHFEAIIECIETQNAAGLKEMFSPDTRNQVPSLDIQIQQLFAFCTGKMESFTKSAIGSSKSRDVGSNYQEVFTTYDFTTRDGNYRMAFLFCSIASENPDNIGLHSVFIIRAENSDRNRAYWGGDEWIPGVTIQ